MSSGIGIAVVVSTGLVVAAVMRARAIARLRPVIDAAARRHGAAVHQSFLGMPQIIKTIHGRPVRMTPMNTSTSSPEGGGEMTCVDFDWTAPGVGEFRMRERPDALRNAVPAVLAGRTTAFTLGIPVVDERYSIAGTNPEAATRLLTDAAVVESVIELPRGADIHVRGNRCSVTVKGSPSQVEVVDLLFATSQRLLEAANGVHAGQV